MQLEFNSEEERLKYLCDGINGYSQQIEQEQKEKNCQQGLFVVRPVNDWIEQAKNKPIPNRLFDDFFFEGEACCLFASSNVGKSILSVQIGNSISKGIAIKGFKLTAQSQVVLYFDFELSAKQFENRYSENYTNHYVFSDSFLRVEINPDNLPDGKSFEDSLNESLELTINAKGAKVLIIDNLTYLKNDTEKAKDASTLMKHLKALKSRYGLSILVLAHTPKRDISKPLSINDLAGSSMLGNFFDSAFTIGASAKDKSLRYIKQIKVRETEKRYDSDNIITCQIAKYSNFVEFDFLDFGTEREHLKEVSEKDKSENKELARTLKNEGISNVEIAKRCGVSEGAVRKWFKKE
jgi:RecA-family ATPase